MSRMILYINLILFLSCSNQKHKNAESISQSGFSYKGQVQRTLNLKFNFKKSDPSVLSALIFSEQDYPYPLEYEWKLGSDVFVSDSNQVLKGKISGLEKNKTVTISLKLLGLNNQFSRHLRFEIIGQHPTQRVFADGTFNSQMSSTFESLVQEIESSK